MSNVGSISDQSIAGVISTATHGTGTTFKSISTHVLELGMLLADGSRVVCSRCKNEDLFLATLCGLGITGLIVTVKLQVEAAFRLKETRDVIPFDECLDDLDMHAESAEHVRIWWFPQTNCVRLLKANRTSEVCTISRPLCLLSHTQSLSLGPATSRKLVLGRPFRILHHPATSVPGPVLRTA
jgi:L-gulonolactone oxidase